MVNTANKGSVRQIVFKEDDCWYAVALEFNIVESAPDADTALERLKEAVIGYIECQQKIKGTHSQLLNQKPDDEYEMLWKTLTNPPSDHNVERDSNKVEVKYFGRYTFA